MLRLLTFIILIHYYMFISPHSKLRFWFINSIGILQEIKAHRSVLSSCSDVFQAMLYGPLAETTPIRVTDIDGNNFYILLK